jgi:FtsP/CotA-like multicopper oxidase with cupredoxin domain
VLDPVWLGSRGGDLVRVHLDNQLPTDTTIHWHGIALRNVADGVPGLTQNPVGSGSTYTYEFTVPDPGTYFYHPHVGVQLDRALYAPLIIDDPREPGGYDAEWVVVLDDWIDGTGRTPDDVLDELTSSTGSGSGMHDMNGMGMGGMGRGTPPFGEAGDITYPYFLINGRVATAPETHLAQPGQRIRLRIINAAADTIFTVALADHRMTITHSDGFAVQPRETDALYIGMGERYDAIITLADGVFPLVAVPFGKHGQAMALVRTGAGSAASATARPRELRGGILLGADLLPTEGARLPDRPVDVATRVTLSGQMRPYAWGINGAPYGMNTPVTVREGQRMRMEATNMTMMSHPLHLHGHTFALADSGLRKDTVLLRPMESRPIDVQADNVGDWALHCHNAYHAEAGMMIALNYQT